ncbi:MAG: hypothetical protein WAK84_15460 [Candidatus Cybelea sp.]
MNASTFTRCAVALSSIFVLASCGAGAGTLAPPPLPANEHALLHQQTFNYTGGEQSFKVPAGVTSIVVDARGAPGAARQRFYLGHPGRGGHVTATIPVRPGETLAVFVGGESPGVIGGFNGGGSSIFVSGCTRGGGGGGASDVREGGNALRDRILVAGGGGGEGGYWGGGGNDGGGGGGKKGGNGRGGPSGSLYGNGGGGQGGTQSNGGAGGDGGGKGYKHHGTPGSSGALGAGGSGGVCLATNYVGGSGGGGGGGYYGGGGGGGSDPTNAGGGGGGGSGYVEPSATNVHFQRASKKRGNGAIVFSWN